MNRHLTLRRLGTVAATITTLVTFQLIAVSLVAAAGGLSQRATTAASGAPDMRVGAGPPAPKRNG
jgi:hypothetical protein